MISTKVTRVASDFNNIRDKSSELKSKSESVVRACDKLSDEYCKLIETVNSSRKDVSNDKHEII